VTPATSLPGSSPTAARRLIDDFNSKRDGRALAIELWSQPSLGGRFYESTLVDSCASIESSTDILKDAQPQLAAVSPENQSKVIAAFDRLRARCAQFTEEEYQKYSRRGLLRQNEGQDPLVKKVRRLIGSGQAAATPTRTSAVKDVLSTADPLLFEDVGLQMSLYSGKQGIYIYFDGTRYLVNQDPPIATAYYLLPCGLGLACDASDPGLAMRCIQANECYADRFERVQKEIAAGDAARYEDILRLYRSMLAAVMNQELSRFIPTQE